MPDEIFTVYCVARYRQYYCGFHWANGILYIKKEGWGNKECAMIVQTFYSCSYTLVNEKGKARIPFAYTPAAAAATAAAMVIISISAATSTISQKQYFSINVYVEKKNRGR